LSSRTRNDRATILTASPAARARLRQARRYALVDATVLITGETGVGKDLLARDLHACGPRALEPFVTIDCPALPATLVEAELFGHERGAFTGALTGREGRFERAGRGTVYLDAVTGLSAPAQASLLRVLEERLVTRLGGTRSIAIRARIVASAEASIGDLVADGRFRADLFHRLRVLPIEIPPLRERPDEILPLARLLIANISSSLARRAPEITPRAQDALVRYRWPGNIRELRHVLERVLLGGVGDTIGVTDLPIDLLEANDADLPSAAAPPPTLEELERRYIALTLGRVHGHQTRAATILGISRKSLWEKRRRFSLD